MRCQRVATYLSPLLWYRKPPWRLDQWQSLVVTACSVDIFCVYSNVVNPTINLPSGMVLATHLWKVAAYLLGYIVHHYTWEGVTRKVVVSDVITLIVVVMWLQLGWFMNRGGAWNWTFRAERRYLDPKREHPTMSMVAHHLVHLNCHLEVYIVRHTHRAGKKSTVRVSTNSNVSFCGTYGCSNLSLSSHRWVRGKWMSKNPNFKSNDDGDEEDDDDDVDDDGDDDETLRRGCCVKRRTRHVTRVHLGGAWNWTFRAERRYLNPKREHGCSSLSPFK